MNLEDYVNKRLSEELSIIENSERGKYDIPLSKFERAIVYKYTDDGYESLNESLRDGKGMPEFGHFLNSALSKLPNYDKLCYRSIRCDDSALVKYYEASEKNIVITEKTFLSCSKSKLLALMFSNSPLFIIKSKTAKDVEKISKFGLENLSQNEKEVIFKSGSRFKVLEILDGEQVVISLEEV